MSNIFGEGTLETRAILKFGRPEFYFRGSAARGGKEIAPHARASGAVSTFTVNCLFAVVASSQADAFSTDRSNPIKAAAARAKSPGTKRE